MKADPMGPGRVPRQAFGRAAWPTLVLLCLLLASCSTLPGIAYAPPSGSALCLPSFPDRDGWYGGDGAYSIDLDDGRVLWLFGDTFVSDQEGRQDRVDMKVVLGTTLAVSTCGADGQFRIRYFLKKDKGEFVSSFGEGEEEWLWPQDPFRVGQRLYVPLLSVQADPRVEGPFKFRIAGHRIARIGDFAGPDPNRWSADYLDLTPGLPEGIQAFATTSVVQGDHVYFYPLYGATKDGLSLLGNILARIPLEGLEDPARTIEFWTRDGRWERGLDHARVKVVLEAAVSELSVRYHPEAGRWIAVYMSIRNRGDRMLYQTAEALEGPWSEPRALIAPIPEVDPAGPRYEAGNFCYAGKEHRAFSRGRKLVVTYVCNSSEDFENRTSFIRRNLDLYRPIVNDPSY